MSVRPFPVTGCLKYLSFFTYMCLLVFRSYQKKIPFIKIDRKLTFQN